MSNFPKRDAISRSRFFLDIAKECPIDNRDEFEAYLEASIIFARAAIHRFQSEYKNNSNWKPWWNEILFHPAVIFFQKERNRIIKEGPPKVGQIIGLGSTEALNAAEFYYFEDPRISATETVEKHLDTLEALLAAAKLRFLET